VDYLSGSFPITFEAGYTEATLRIVIQDDFIAEGPHDFLVHFNQSSFSGAIEVYRSSYTTIIITGKQTVTGSMITGHKLHTIT